MPQPPEQHRVLAESDLPAEIRTSWRHFHLAFESLRPELYRFCRHLTRSPWDAEDLVQDTLARAFVMLQYTARVDHPRALLFRVATNLWIDRLRRAHEELHPAPEELAESAPPSPAPDVLATRRAAGTLIARLSPQERVAVVLKDAFDLSLDDIAGVLATTTGAIKAALHRGRGKLAADEPAAPRVPVPAAIDAFCAALNAGDLAGLTAVLLDAAVIEMPGLALDLGAAATADATTGILYHVLHSRLTNGVPARYLEDFLVTGPRGELRRHRGEVIALLWYGHRGGDAVRAFLRFTVDGPSGQIASVRAHFFAPEALAELAGELGVPYRVNGYGHADL